jgi:hypothetical protein
MWGKIKFDSQRRYDGAQLNQFFEEIVLIFEKGCPIPIPPDGVELSIRSTGPAIQKRVALLPTSSPQNKEQGNKAGPAFYPKCP